MSFNKKNVNKLFYIFIACHLILWTFVPSITNKNLPLDTIEALAWGSNLDWGFNKHPPASAFFVEIFYQIFGSRDWAYYFLSQIFVVISLFFIWKLSREFFKNKIYCFISVILLEGIYFYNYTTPEFNVYISQLPFWALTVFYAYKASIEDNIKDWLLLGFWGSIGFLSHYLFAYILLSISIFFIYSFYKNKKFNFKCLVSLEVFIILIIPHLIWLFKNDFITIIYALHRTESASASSIINHLINPLSYLLKQIGILTPFWILLFFLIKKFKFKINFKDKKLIFLIFINFCPIILIALTSLLTGSKIKTMWMTPFYLCIGILAVYIFQKHINFKKLKYFFISIIFFFILSPVVYSLVSISKNDKRTDYPGKLIAEKVQKKWNTDYNEPIKIVLGNEWKAGNLSYHLKSRPVWEGFITEDKLDSLSKFICVDDVCIGIK